MKIGGTGEIYHAQDENYVGRSDDLVTRDANSTDGIDRSPDNISIEDIYLEGDTIEAQIKEQRVIDVKDSVVNGANKRDEISRAARGLPKDPTRK